MINIPTPNKISKTKLIKFLREEIERKDKLIDELKRENMLLLSLSIKNARRRLEDELKDKNKNKNKDKNNNDSF